MANTPESRKLYMREYMRQRRAGIATPVVNLDTAIFTPTSQAKVNSTMETQAVSHVSIFDAIPLWAYALVLICVVASIVYIPSLAVNQAVNKQEINKEPG